MAVIETEQLKKNYGKSRGISDLTLSVEKGEIFGFLGPNGAGKTTTIRLLLGLIFPTSGSAKIEGHDVITDTIACRKHVGYVPGDVDLYPKMRVGELLDYFARFRPETPAVLKDSIVKRIDLDLSPRVKDLSHGTKQKIAIVLAFMHDPDVLILDEPTLGLDPLVQQEFYAMLKDFKNRGKSIFLSSHVLPEVERICDRIGIIKEGKLVTVESIETMHAKEVRHVEVTFDGDINLAAFKLPGVDIVSHANRSLHLKVKGGEIDPVIKAISKFKVKDLVFAHASLEEVFLEFYGKEEEV